MAGIRQFTVAEGQLLLAFLLSALGQSRASIKKLLKFGAIGVNGAAQRKFDHALLPGDQVTVGNLQHAAAAHQLAEARIRPVYEDEDLIVVEKPAGLLTVATDSESLDTLFVRLNEFLRSRDPARPGRAQVVHRLDRETSGLVLFAKSKEVKTLLQASWSEVEKIYIAVVHGRFMVPQGTMSHYLLEDEISLKVAVCEEPEPDARLAITHYQVLKTRGERTMVECRLQTGRKHQIRVQLSNLGCPVVGDRRYGKSSDSTSRLGLHACKLALVHPRTQERLEINSPLPNSLRKMLAM